MSRFLLNLLLQISKALVYSKIKFLFGKEFSFTFSPIGPAASRPNRGPLVFQPDAPPLPTGPQPLGRPSSPSRPSRLRVGGALPNCRLPFEKVYFKKTTFPSRMRTPRKSATSARPISAGPTTTPTRPWPVGRAKSTSPPTRPTGFIARSAQAAHLATRVFFLLRMKATRPPPPLRATITPPCAAAPASPPP
jgi:hypothetical protein